jgi:hypothetical protein
MMRKEFVRQFIALHSQRIRSEYKHTPQGLACEVAALCDLSERAYKLWVRHASAYAAMAWVVPIGPVKYGEQQILLG